MKMICKIEKCASSYHYYDKYLAPDMQVTYSYTDKNVHTLSFSIRMLLLPSKLGQVQIFLGISLGLHPREIPRNICTCPRLDGRNIPLLLLERAQRKQISRGIL